MKWTDMERPARYARAKTVGGFRAHTRRRKAARIAITPPIEVQHGDYVVRITSRSWEPWSGHGGIFGMDRFTVVINGRTIEVAGTGSGHLSLPRPYGFVARVAFAKAVRAIPSRYWRIG